ncbi:MAG: peptidoglycan editing factor PgeF [Methylococcales bacterium]|nr:peptidoglycan editing factor PgeF [Methylococcales bacterium]
MNKINRWLVPNWPAPANIHAAATLRIGGMSEGIYAGLNAASHVGDDPERVRQNRQIIAEMLDLPDEPVWLDQVHSNRVVKAQNPPFTKGDRGDLQQADASYTDESGVVCAVMTADCLPLLICSTDGAQVAAIHAGWRGLLARVISNTVAAMRNSAISSRCGRDGSEDLIVWLGPAIGPDCFEVGAEVHEAFLEKSAEFDSAFKEQGGGKWLADIYQLARIELAGLNIFNVYGGDNCTVTEHDRFYSYRRDGQTGRMATLIWRE